MRCEEFDPEDYTVNLIGIAVGERTRESALESYLHCETCEEDRRKFDNFVVRNYKPTSDEYGLIYEGLKIVGELAEELE